MARSTYHWMARNFALKDGPTRQYVENELIPSWRREIQDWKNVITLLAKHPLTNQATICECQGVMAALENNIAHAEERLRQS